MYLGRIAHRTLLPLLFPLILFAGTHPAKADCQGQDIVRAFVGGDYQAARKADEACIAASGENLAKNPGDTINLALENYYVCVGSQIAAEEGRLLTAKDMLDSCKRNATGWQMIDEESVLTLTEGFYLERAAGDGDAEYFYLQHQNSQTMARLAVLALKRHDTTAAVDWAAKALKGGGVNLTALIVLASATDASDDLLRRQLMPVLDGTDQSHEFMPASYAEVWWASIWLRQTGRVGPMPLDD